MAVVWVLQFPYAEAIVRESLRLYPPATLLNREIKEGGFDLMGRVSICLQMAQQTPIVAFQAHSVTVQLKQSRVHTCIPNHACCMLSRQVYNNAVTIHHEAVTHIRTQVHVPAGASVMSFLYSYQRDPDYWPAPLEFRPERWLPVSISLHGNCSNLAVHSSVDQRPCSQTGNQYQSD